MKATEKMETRDRIEFTAAGGCRLDKLISDSTELSRSAAVKLIEQGLVTVNGKPCGKKDVPNEGSIVAVCLLYTSDAADER